MPEDTGTLGGCLSLQEMRGALLFFMVKDGCLLKACLVPPHDSRFGSMLHSHCGHGWNRPSTAPVIADLHDVHKACLWRCSGGQSCRTMAAFTQHQRQTTPKASPEGQEKMMLEGWSLGGPWQVHVEWDYESRVTRRSPEMCETSILSQPPRTAAYTNMWLQRPTMWPMASKQAEGECLGLTLLHCVRLLG